jgi:hypothetical protein
MFVMPSVRDEPYLPQTRGTAAGLGNGDGTGYPKRDSTRRLNSMRALGRLRRVALSDTDGSGCRHSKRQTGLDALTATRKWHSFRH